jgi:hypothetical protein
VIIGFDIQILLTWSEDVASASKVEGELGSSGWRNVRSVSVEPDATN